MFNKYFQQELDNLRDLGAEFSKAHPAVAPMLSGRSSDPDVDRLLEGVDVIERVADGAAHEGNLERQIGRAHV